MDAKEYLRKAFQEGRAALSEAESKQILAAYGVPVVPEIVAKTAAEAAREAGKIGFPVVLKGLGSTLLHKSEMGIVHVGLGSEGEVLAAAEDISAKAGAALEGFLVQPQIAGRREFVAGLFRDPQFGPVIMFGLGGVFTEAIADVVFRLAPLTERDIADMLEEFRSKKLLGDFRGEKAVNRAHVTAALLGLSRLAMECPEVVEVDVNPLLAGHDGGLTAVDALVILGAPVEKKNIHVPVPPEKIAAIFYPKSIAFVGMSARLGKWGHNVATCAIAGGYEGAIHFVNPKGGTIFGRPVLKSVRDLTEPVDLAVVTIPAAQVMDLMDDLAEKNIKNVLLITSGFGEIGPEGKDLGRRLVEKARAHDILILGTNTMGITNPHISLFCMGSHIRTPAGSTAMVAQSGNMGAQLMSFASRQNIGLRAFCGSGNEAMISIEDFMEGFEKDKVTRQVVLYIESVKDGRRFFESARRVGASKPVVVLKGGRTGAGGRAAASHTGAMAGDSRVFDAACRQAGVVRVNQPMDLLDLSAAFSALPLPRGNRVAIMTLGGGWGVVTADLCDEYGLNVVPLSPEVFEKVNAILPPFWSRGNPIDLVGENDPTIPVRVADVLMAWDGCDAVLNLGILGRKIALNRMVEDAIASDPKADKEHLYALHKALCDIEDRYVEHLAALMERYDKPILGVPLVSDDSDKTMIPVPGKKYKGVFFKTPERAVKALAKMNEYQKFHISGKA